jgi:hypothetical protein
MKKLFIIAVLLTAAIALASCKDLKGGTIEVTNSYTLGGVNMPVLVTINKDVKDNKVIKEINYGATEKFSFDEDGYYTVLAATASIPPFTESFYLLGGSTKQVTVK